MSCSTSARSKCAGARPKVAKSNPSASAARLVLGLDRLRGAEAGEQRQQGERLDPRLAQGVDPGRAEALGQLAFGRDEQGFVGEVRRRAAERFEHLDLGRAVRDMVLAADDVGDGEVEVVDHAGEQIEPAAVGAADDGVADQRRVELLVAADEVVPLDRRGVVEAEAPVRGDAFGDGRVGGLALIDRRQAAAEQHLAAEVEFFGGFVAGVDAARRLQPLELALVEGEALGLADGGVGLEAEPGEVGVDRLDERFGRALGVGVVDPQQELAALRQREQGIVERGADIADVEPAGRRRGEAGGDGHGPPLPPLRRAALATLGRDHPADARTA